MSEPDFGAAPETVAHDGFVITDGGMERESADDLRSTLTDEAPLAADAPDDPPARGDDPSDRDVETEGAAPIGAPREAKPAAEPAKGKRTIEGRVAELQKEIGLRTREKHDTIRERDAAKAELDRFRAEMAQLKSQTPQERTAAAAPPKADAPQGVIPKKPIWTEFDEAGKGWDDYLGALDTYLEARIDASTGAVKSHFEAELRKVRDDGEQTTAALETRAAEAAVDAAHKARVRAVVAARPDFGEVVANLKDVEQTDFMRDVVKMHPQGAELLYTLGQHADAAAILSSLDFTQTMFDVVMESDNPSALLLHLADDTVAFDELRSMPSAVANRRLAALDARLSTSPPAPRASGSRGPGTSVSRAATPIRPVGGTSKAPVTDSDADSDDEPLEAWLARENKRDSERARY